MERAPTPPPKLPALAYTIFIGPVFRKPGLESTGFPQRSQRDFPITLACAENPGFLWPLYDLPGVLEMRPLSPLKSSANRLNVHEQIFVPNTGLHAEIEYQMRGSTVPGLAQFRIIKSVSHMNLDKRTCIHVLAMSFCVQIYVHQNLLCLELVGSSWILS